MKVNHPQQNQQLQKHDINAPQNPPLSSIKSKKTSKILIIYSQHLLNLALQLVV